MKRVTLAILLVSIFTITFLSVTSVDANAVGLSWSFDEGDFIDYRITSDGLITDEIVSFRIDSPLPDTVEIPPDTYNIGALHDWMDIPVVPVTAIIPFGGTPSEVEGFDYIFSYCGLSQGYWCRFAVPNGVPDDTYKYLVGNWTDGPHGTIETHILEPSLFYQNLYWGFEYGFEFSDTIYNVTAWYFSTNRRLANVTITGHDSSTGAQTHYAMMVTDYRPPHVTSPEDMNFTVGTTGEEIRWGINEEAPYSYELFRNGTSIASGDFDQPNQNVIFSLDDAEIGVWNYTIAVTDYLLTTVTDSVIVTVERTPGLNLSTDTLLLIGGVGAIVIIGAVIIIRRK
jgi:hypothetical protein